MSGTASARTVVVDANIVINFIHVGRLALRPPSQATTASFQKTSSPRLLSRRSASSCTCHGRWSLRIETITEPDDLVQYADYDGR